MNNPFDFLEIEDLPEDECCMCAEPEVAANVRIGTQTYAFCTPHEHRCQFLQRGQSRDWPALRTEGVTGTYALDSDWEAWFLTAMCGTDERVVELLDALDEYEEAQKIA